MRLVVSVRDGPLIRESRLMLRIFLVPVVGLGAIALIAGHGGDAVLPSTILGLPTPMVLFAGLSAFILSMLRTT